MVRAEHDALLQLQAEALCAPVLSCICCGSRLVWIHSLSVHVDVPCANVFAYFVAFISFLVQFEGHGIELEAGLLKH
jgi:hypothetical protein